jgi:hypothetical protein
MRTKPPSESNTAIRLRTHLENLRSYLVDLEALAHAARETLDQLPYMPRSSGPDAPDLEVRLNYGRLQAMVTATATSAKDVLIACDEMLDDPGEPPDDEDDEDGGSEEPSGSSGNGGSNVSGAGHMPQARQESGAAERLEAPGSLDDGRAELPGLIGSRVPGASCLPRARQSRGGIMLDVAAGPPELVPVLAGSAHVAPQPTPSA